MVPVNLSPLPKSLNPTLQTGMHMERHENGRHLPNSLADERGLSEGELSAEGRLDTLFKHNGQPFEEALLSPRSQVLRGREEGFQERRMTYPAGKIYHLVPARLVFGTSALLSSNSTAFTQGMRLRFGLDS